MNTQIIEELRGGDIPFGTVGFNIDSLGKYFFIRVENYSSLPIYFIVVESSGPMPGPYKHDFVEFNEMKLTERSDRNVLQINSNWFCSKKYINNIEDSCIEIIFSITWRSNRYLAKSRFEKDTEGYYRSISTEYFYKRALYNYDEMRELAMSKEKKFKQPLIGH